MAQFLKAWDYLHLHFYGISIVFKVNIFITAALALGSRGLVIGSREEKEEKEEKVEEKNLQIAIRCL